MTETLELEASFSGELYHEYTFRVRARDLVGHVSDWITTTVAIVNQTKYYFLEGRRVAMRKGDQVFYLYGDHLGSTSLTTDENGVKLSEDRYLPYGGGRLSDGVSPTDFGFTDQRNEVGLGLMDYNARYYDPYLNRFISPDPIIPDPANPQSWNRYSYVYNNPVRYTDPSGHCNQDVGDEDCWAKYEQIKDACPECNELLTVEGMIPLEEASYVRLDNFLRFNIRGEQPPLGPAINGDPIVEALAGALCEPCDWGFMVYHWSQGDFHPLDAATLLPLVSVGMVRGIEGVAEVRYFNLDSGPHFSINVKHGTQSLETDQVIITSANQTTIRITRGLPNPAKTMEIPLPNAQAAQEAQNSLIGRNTGTYDANTNSCVTHVCDILRAGGLNAPTTTREGIRFLRSQR